jgi:hypothetical protein
MVASVLGAIISFSEQEDKKRYKKNKVPETDVEIFLFIIVEYKWLLTSNVVFLRIKKEADPLFLKS